MAFLRKRGNKIHIFYYDQNTGMQTSKSTGLYDNPVNRKQAEKIKNLFEKEMRCVKEKMILDHIYKRVTINDAFNKFKLVNADKHPKTIKDYERFYKYFLQVFNPNMYCTQINKVNIENWFLKIKGLDQKPNSIHALGKQALHFLNYLFEENFTPHFIINRRVKTKAESVEKIYFTDDHIIKIFEGLDSENNNFKTLIYLAFYTGLRSSDMIGIDVEKIDLKNLTLKYFSPKTKKHREIPIHPELEPVLTERIKQVNIGKLLNYGTEESLGRAINRYLYRIGLNGKGYSARTFRKTFATLCRNKFRIEESIVQYLIGHQAKTIMDKHYNSYDVETLRSELNKFQPIISSYKIFPLQAS